MLLTELIEDVVSHLNTNRSLWTDDTDLTVTAELDVFAPQTTDLQVYVMPEVCSLMRPSRQRGNSVKHEEQLVIQLVLSKQFEALSTSNGVTNWAEAKTIIDTWQKAQRVATTYQTGGLVLHEVESTPPTPLELDNRLYVVMTTLAYEQVVCVTQPVFSMPSPAFSGGSILHNIRDSIASQD